MPLAACPVPCTRVHCCRTLQKTHDEFARSATKPLVCPPERIRLVSQNAHKDLDWWMFSQVDIHNPIDMGCALQVGRHANALVQMNGLLVIWTGAVCLSNVRQYPPDRRLVLGAVPHISLEHGFHPMRFDRASFYE